jgi:Flp pilus assembly protein TadG
MTRRTRHRHLAEFCREEGGAVMVEFAIVCGLFFLVFFQVFDFGLFASNTLMAEKASQLAGRIAVVRPPACAGVPDRHAAGGLQARYGTSCSWATGVCAAQAPVTCNGSAANPTASEIWARISPTLPPGTTIDDLTFTYTFDPNLGYLGGPYTPMVTVELTLPVFQFISPISELARNAAGGVGSGFSAPKYKVFSITLPGEDLALATNG